MSPIEKIQSTYSQPDHPFWSKVGNIAVIVVAPVGTAIIEVFVPDPWKRIVQVAFSSVMGLIKLGTKFTVNK